VFSSLRRGVLIAMAVVAASVTAGVSLAPASVDTYYNGGNYYIYSGRPWLVGSAHTLTYSVGYVGANLCVGAIDVYGGTLSGAGACSVNFGAGTGFEWINHPYCQCALRDPAIYPYTGYGVAQTGQGYY
jgi:hypothetical protein